MGGHRVSVVEWWWGWWVWELVVVMCRICGGGCGGWGRRVGEGGCDYGLGREG